jgi:hypothetical protein
MTFYKKKCNILMLRVKRLKLIIKTQAQTIKALREVEHDFNCAIESRDKRINELEAIIKQLSGGDKEH